MATLRSPAKNFEWINVKFHQAQSCLFFFSIFFAWQADVESASPAAAEPEPETSGSEFDDGTTLQLGSPSPREDVDTDDEEVPPLENVDTHDEEVPPLEDVDTDDEEVPPLEDARGDEVADTMMDDGLDGDEVSDIEPSQEPDAEPSQPSPVEVFESPMTPKRKSYGWREELFTTPQFGNSGPTRPEMVEMCIALMEFFKENYPDILKSLSFQHATYFCFSSPKAPKMFGN